MIAEKMNAAQQKKFDHIVLAKLAMLDPWIFMTNFCFTKDEHDKTKKAKLFPKKLYIRVLMRGALEH